MSEFQEFLYTQLKDEALRKAYEVVKIELEKELDLELDLRSKISTANRLILVD